MQTFTRTFLTLAFRFLATSSTSTVSTTTSAGLSVDHLQVSTGDFSSAIALLSLYGVQLNLDPSSLPSA